MKSSNISAKRFMQPAHSILKKGGKSVLLRYSLQKYVNCVEDVPTIHVNFITIVIIVSEKKNKEALLSYCPSYIVGKGLSCSPKHQNAGASHTTSSLPAITAFWQSPKPLMQ
jgi:hypothetical protein